MAETIEVRARRGGVSLRAANGAPPTLYGHFATFGTWYEVDSLSEGRFVERVAPGTFAKTMLDDRDGLRVLFQHGMDPEIGDKPIAAIADLREDATGAYYEAPLFEGLPPLVADGLRAGVYGASHRFVVRGETWNQRPEKADHNPDGLPERTITEARVFEIGPVTWPANPAATAAVRSLTDQFRDRHGVSWTVDDVNEIVDAVDRLLAD